jgi:hypothetical protein
MCASIFSVEDMLNKQGANSKTRLGYRLLTDRLLEISSTLKEEAVCSFATLVYLCRTTRRHIPEESVLHSHRCENLGSNLII